MPSIAASQSAQHADNDTLLDAFLADITAVRAVLAGIISGSATFDAGSIDDGNEEAVEITVTGAVLGDYVLVSHGVDVADLGIVGAVTAADTVTAVVMNNTGGAIDLASATIRAVVLPFASFAAPAALTVTA